MTTLDLARAAIFAAVLDALDPQDRPSPEAIAPLAEEALWAVVAHSCPTALSGDLSPGTSAALTQAIEAAVAEWVETNVPEDEPVCDACGGDFNVLEYPGNDTDERHLCGACGGHGEGDEPRDHEAACCAIDALEVAGYTCEDTGGGVMQWIRPTPGGYVAVWSSDHTADLTGEAVWLSVYGADEAPVWERRVTWADLLDVRRAWRPAQPVCEACRQPGPDVRGGRLDPHSPDLCDACWAAWLDGRTLDAAAAYEQGEHCQACDGRGVLPLHGGAARCGACEGRGVSARYAREFTLRGAS